jgi:hypothetical protein
VCSIDRQKAQSRRASENSIFLSFSTFGSFADQPLPDHTDVLPTSHRLHGVGTPQPPRPDCSAQLGGGRAVSTPSVASRPEVSERRQWPPILHYSPTVLPSWHRQHPLLLAIDRHDADTLVAVSNVTTRWPPRPRMQYSVGGESARLYPHASPCLESPPPQERTQQDASATQRKLGNTRTL